MKKINDVKCPCCGEDITEFIRQEIRQYVQRHKADAVNQQLKNCPEKRQKMTMESTARLQKWKAENPEMVRASANRAQMCRTKDTFAKQAQTIRETLQRKSVIFAELLLDAKEKGQSITPETERDLLKKASQMVKDEKAARKKAARP